MPTPFLCWALPLHEIASLFRREWRPVEGPGPNQRLRGAQGSGEGHVDHRRGGRRPAAGEREARRG